MTEPISIITSALTALGVAGTLTAVLQARYQQRAQVTQHEHDEKHARYRCLHMLMQAKLHPRIGLPKLRQVRPDIQTSEDLDFELGTELLTGIVYADDAVMEALGQFIQEPTQASFIKVGTAMRDDLWGKQRRKRADLASIITDALASSPAYDTAIEEHFATIPAIARPVESKAALGMMSTTKSHS